MSEWTGRKPTTMCTSKTRTANGWPAGVCPKGLRASPDSTRWSVPMPQEPNEVVIGIETDRGLFVAALVAAGYEVFAVNPMSTSRYRDRHSTSGAKSDPGDAKVLADMVRTDRHNHRPVAGDSELAEAIKVLARAHQSMIWARGRQTNFLRSTLREFYPAALVAFDDLASGDALEVLQDSTHPRPWGRTVPVQDRLRPRRGGRQRRIDQRAEQIQELCARPSWAARPWWPPPWAPRSRHGSGGRHHERPDRRAGQGARRPF